MNGRLPCHPDVQHMGGGKLVDGDEHRTRVGDEAKRQVLVQREGVDLPETGRHLEDRLDLGCEVESLASAGPKKRLLAQMVPREKEPASAAVPEGDGEHPAQSMHEVGPVVLVQMN
jgi:hypothetical protein